MNLGGGGCSELRSLPLHSSLGDRADSGLKKKKEKNEKKSKWITLAANHSNFPLADCEPAFGNSSAQILLSKEFAKFSFQLRQKANPGSTLLGEGQDPD